MMKSDADMSLLKWKLNSDHIHHLYVVLIEYIYLILYADMPQQFILIPPKSIDQKME